MTKNYTPTNEAVAAASVFGMSYPTMQKVAFRGSLLASFGLVYLANFKWLGSGAVQSIGAWLITDLVLTCVTGLGLGITAAFVEGKRQRR